MKSLMLMVLGLLLGQRVWAQGVVWEYTQAGRGMDKLNDVVDLGDCTYLACGMRSRYRHDTLPGSLPNLGILRIRRTGDTVYVRNLDMYLDHASSRLCRLSNGEVYVMGTGQDFLFYPQFQLGKIDPETGRLIDIRLLQGYSRAYITVKRVIEGPENSLIFCGLGPDTGSSANVGYLARYDRQGGLIWSKIMREHPSNTFCNWVEMTTRGTLIVSGSAGSRIWAAELTADSGREVRRTTFYQTPSLIYFDEWSSVRQAPRDQFVVSGSNQRYRSYLGLYQSWGGSRIWGSEHRGTSRLGQVNLDGGLVYFEALTPNFSLIRIRNDSTIYWSTPFPQRAMQENTLINSFSFSLDTIGIAVGSIGFPGWEYDNWYVARITNMGIPYDPSTVVSAKPEISVKPYAYPTPCRESLGFSGLRNLAKLEIVDVQGRVVLAAEILPDQMVDVSALVPGLYQYRLTSRGRVYSGRVMKE